MAITVLLPCLTPIASQMNFRDDAKAKSRTFFALKTHFLVLVSFFVSAALASSSVTIMMGLSDVFAN